MLATDGCVSNSSNPACCFCVIWALSGPRGVAVAMFGPTGLDMLICNESVWSLSLCRWSRVLCDLGGLMFTCGLVR